MLVDRKAQAGQMAKEAHPFVQVGLALPFVARGEIEMQFGDAQIGVAHQNFQQYLEPLRLEAGRVDGRAAQDEKAGQRVGDVLQHARKDHAGQDGQQLRGERSHAAEAHRP